MSDFQAFYQRDTLTDGMSTPYASSRSGYRYIKTEGLGGVNHLATKNS